MTTSCDHRYLELRDVGRPGSIAARCPTCKMELTNAQVRLAKVYRKKLLKRTQAAERRSVR